MKYIIANWKAHKNLNQAQEWITEFVTYDFSHLKHKVQIIICPPFPFIPLLKEKVLNFPFIKIGSQDVSVYYEGAYTGEVTARTLAGIADYSIVGHSERRQHFNESEAILFNKVQHLKQQNIKTIYCIRNIEDKVPESVAMIAYEPVFAIGTGESDSIENVIKVKHELKLSSHTPYIYGGSVTEDNASIFLLNMEIDGVLIGGASLEPKRFYQIISICA